MGRIKAYKGRIIGLALLSVILPFIVLLVIVMRFENMASQGMMAELDQIAADRANNIARDIYALCDVSYNDTKEKTERALGIIRDRLKNGDYITAGQVMVKWEIENPDTKKTETFTLPQMMMGNIWLGQNTAAGKAMVPAFEDLRRLTGGHITVFQKMDTTGNMLAVANSILTAAEEREIGVCLPARDAGGVINPLTERILTGESFQAMEMVNDDWYLSYYEPIKDKGGLVLGMLSYREKWNAMDLLKGFFASHKVGEQGEVSFIAAHGKDYGRYIASEGYSLFGSKDWDGRDDKGRNVFSALVQEAMKQPPGKIVSGSYWASVQDVMGKNIAAVVYFENYSSLIFVRTMEDDFYAPLARMRDLLPRFMTEIAVAGSFFFLIFVLMAAFLERKITAGFQFLADLANALVKGDMRHAKLTLEKEWTASIKKKKGFSREIRESLDAFQTLIVRTKLHSSGLQGGKEPGKLDKPEKGKILTLDVLVDDGEGERRSAKTRERQAQQEEQNKKMGAISREIDQIQSRLSQTIEAAASGRKNLEEIEGNMHGLVRSSTNLADQFHDIQDKTRLLSEDIKKMVDIAEESNTRSLNVFLEAKNGEHSALHLSEGIYDVSVLSGGGEKMARGIDGQANDLQTTMVSSLREQAELETEIRRNVEKITDIRQELDMIIDHLQGYDLKIQTLLQEMDFHSAEEGKAVDEAMVFLSKESTRMGDCIRQFGSSMDELISAVDQLRGDAAEEDKGIITNFKTVTREIRQMAQETGTVVQDVAERVKELQGSISADAKKDGDGDVHSRLERVIQVTDRLYQIIDHLRSYNFHLGDLPQMLSEETLEGTRVFTAITGLSAAAEQAKNSLHDFRKATEVLVRHIDKSSPADLGESKAVEMSIVA